MGISHYSYNFYSGDCCSSADSRGDYYDKKFSKAEYKHQLEILLSKKDKQYISVDDHEFKVVGIAGRIFQIVKSLFGLTDHTHMTKVNSEILKFLHYGQTQGYMTDNMILESVKKLKDHLKTSKNLIVNKAIQKVAGQIIKAQQNPKKTPSQRLEKMRGVLLDYHKKFQDKLQPSFIRCLFSHVVSFPMVPKNEVQYFGETYLQLASRAMLSNEHKLTSPCNEAISYEYYISSILQNFQAALDLKNPNQDFQNKLGDLYLKFWKNEHKGSKLSAFNQINAQNIFIQLGKLAIDKLDYPRAKTYALQLLDLSPGHHSAKELLVATAYKAFNNNDYQIAFQYALIGLDYFPGNLQFKDILDTLAFAAYAKEDYANAKIFATAQLQRFPNDQKAERYLGVSYLKMGEIKEAQPYLKTVASANSSDPDMLKLVGSAYAKLKDQKNALLYHEKAVELYEKAGTQEFLNQGAELSFQLGDKFHSKKFLGYFSQPDYKSAIKYYEKAYKLAPKNPHFKRRLLDMYIEAGGAASPLGKLWQVLTFSLSEHQTIEYYKKAKELAPQERGPHVNALIKEYESKEQYQEAVSYYEMMHSLWPEDKFVIEPLTYVSLGDHFYSKDKLKAIECYKKAHALVPENQQFLNTLVVFIQVYVITDPIKPQYQEELLTEAWTLIQSGDEKLKNQIKKSLLEVRMKLAKTHEDMCMFGSLCTPDEIDAHKKKVNEKIVPEAIKWYDKALELNPEDPLLHFQKAEILDFFVDIKKGLEEYRLAVKHDPKNPYYRFRLAEVYNHLGHSAKFEKHKEKALTFGQKGLGLNYLHWYDERFCYDKIYKVDPHKLS